MRTPTLTGVVRVRQLQPGGVRWRACVALTGRELAAAGDGGDGKSIDTMHRPSDARPTHTDSDRSTRTVELCDALPVVHGGDEFESVKK
jgi:hypothetical protein